MSHFSIKIPLFSNFFAIFLFCNYYFCREYGIKLGSETVISLLRKLLVCTIRALFDPQSYSFRLHKGNFFRILARILGEIAELARFRYFIINSIFNSSDWLYSFWNLWEVVTWKFAQEFERFWKVSALSWTMTNMKLLMYKQTMHISTDAWILILPMRRID